MLEKDWAFRVGRKPNKTEMVKIAARVAEVDTRAFSSTSCKSLMEKSSIKAEVDRLEQD